MGFSIIPVEVKFFELFEQQAEHNIQAAKLFKELANHWDSESPLFDKLRDVEHEADRTTHEIIDRINRTFVTPFDREDIHALATEADDIVDLIQLATSRIHLYHVTHSTEDLKQLADILLQATESAAKMVKLLRTPGEMRKILDFSIEINSLENTGDHVLHNAMSKLFSGKPDALEVIKWKDIYEAVESAIDKVEDVANTIEGIVVKQG